MGCVEFRDDFHWGKACQDHKFEVNMEVVVEDKGCTKDVDHVLIHTKVPGEGWDGQWERYAPYTAFGDYVRRGKRYFHGEVLKEGDWAIEAMIDWDDYTTKSMSFESIGICPEEYQRRRLNGVADEPGNGEIWNIDMRQH